jgi:hypothetical protein
VKAGAWNDGVVECRSGGVLGTEARSAEEMKVRQPPIAVNLSDVAAGGAQPRPSSEGRRIPRFQVYRMSMRIPRPRDWCGIR